MTLNIHSGFGSTAHSSSNSPLKHRDDAGRPVMPTVLTDESGSYTGGVELKNRDTDDRAFIDPSGSQLFRNHSGHRGFDHINNTTAVVGEWVEIKTLVVSASLSYVSSSIGDDLSNVDLPAADSIYGDFTSIQLTNSEIIAYRK